MINLPALKYSAVVCSSPSFGTAKFAKLDKTYMFAPKWIKPVWLNMANTIGRNSGSTNR